MLLFKRPLVELISRISKVGVGNKSISVHPPKIQKLDQDLPDRQSKDIIDIIFDTYSEDTMKIFEERVIEDTLINKISPPEERADKLFRYAQALILVTHFNQTYALIYNSQIRILEFLNTSTSRHKDDLKPYYEQAKSDFPDMFEDYGFDDYLNFLVSNLLINVTPENIVEITVVGVDFLKFIIESRLPANKPL
jgi:hypothetical protein